MSLYAGPNSVFESHWAVAALEAPERHAAIGHAERVCANGPPAPPIDDLEHERLTEISGAYDLAVRERLDALSALRIDEITDSARSELEHGASRAFVLQLTLPVPEPRSERALRVLQLAAMADVANRRGDWDRWSPVLVAPGASPESLDWSTPWPEYVLVHVSEMWRTLLHDPAAGRGRAMELIARLRERRPEQEALLYARLTGREAARAKYICFISYQLVDAATDLTVYLKHDEPREIIRHFTVYFSLARAAASGDLELEGVLSWLHAAAIRTVKPRPTQLELPGVAS